MKITLDIKKSLEENSSVYFEKSKKAKKKIAGAEEAVIKMTKRFEKEKKKVKQAEEKRKQRDAQEEERKAKKTKAEWYEKFRWFFTSEGFLVVGGRDATTNEIIIKKHTEKGDIVFHTDMAGSPFFVVKKGSVKEKDAEIGDASIAEVADATCTYSRAWKLGLGTTQVFWVNPDQVSKEAQSGEYMPKGAFMIRGKTNYIPARINLTVGVMKDGKVMGGPVNAVKKHCKKHVELVQGNEKTAAVAKKIKAKISGSAEDEIDIDLDDIIKVIPAGGCKVK
ncbi:NFACT RNA binding domain-containing protein [Thermoproteota archaeon]